VVTALTDSYLVSEDGGAADDDGKGKHEAEDGHPEADDEDDGDDANDGEYECVAPQGALLGPVCVRVGGVGEDVLIT